MKVKRVGAAITVRLSADETALLQMLATHTAALLAPAPANDPLEALTGMSGAPTAEPPEDPALRRLLPDAYGDPEAAGEFRRLTDDELRRTKVAALERLLADTSDDGAAVVTLADEASVETWLQALNDIRLLIGSRLDLRDDDDATTLFRELHSDDPRLPLAWAYDRFTYLQQLLLDALAE